MPKWGKVLGGVCAVLAIIIVTAVVYIKSLDINQFVPQIQQVVQEQTGREVSIAHASLDITFSGGIVLKLDEIVLSDDAAVSKAPFVSIKEIDVSVNWLSYLLSRTVSVGRVVVDQPAIHVIRLTEERFNFTSLIEQTAQAEKPQQDDVSASTGALPLLLVDKINVKNASLVFEDRALPTPMRVAVDQTNILVQEFSLNKPFTVSVRSRVLSSQSNITLDSVVVLDLEKQSVAVSDVAFKFDLAGLEMDALSAMVPDVAQAKLRQPPQGKLVVSLDKATLDASGVPADLQVNVSFTEGMIDTAYLPNALEKITVDAKAGMEKIDLAEAKASYREGSLSASGMIVDYLAVPVADLRIAVENIELNDLAQLGSVPWPLEGALEAETSLFVAGVEPEAIMASLKSDGTLSTTPVVIDGVNFLSQVMEQLAIVPGLSQKLYANLSEQWQDVLGKDKTLIEPVEVAWSMQQGKLVIPTLIVRLEGISVLSRDVNVSLDQQFSAKVNVVLNSDLAAAMVASASELRPLLEKDGSISLPGHVSGQLPDKVNLGLDQQYLSDKLIRIAGEQLLDKVLDKNPEIGGALQAIFGGSSSKVTPEDADSAPAPAEKVQPAELINGLLKGLF